MKVTRTGMQAKMVDQYTIHQIGIPSLVLMERAALAVAQTAEETVSEKGRKAGILVLCGTGNNGADGIAAARILKNRGFDPMVVLTGKSEHATEDWKNQRGIAEKQHVRMQYFSGCEGEIQSADLIIDALFGIGLSREVTGDYRAAIELAETNEKAVKIAVDIASGIHADTGAVMGCALKADITVTFGFQKTGMVLYPGRLFCGEVRIAEIGFAEEACTKAGMDAWLPEREDLKNIPRRRRDGNKGSFGKLLLIAGSDGMCGAAFLSALAAYRTGAGLVRIMTVESNRAILQSLIPEAIVTVFDPEQIRAFTEDLQEEEYLEAKRRLESQEQFQEFIQKQCDWADTIVMGPGLGQKSYVMNIVETVLEHAYVPVVVDADALNMIAKYPYLNRYLTENRIITPHMGEMSRLTGLSIEELKADPVKAAREFSARTGVICVLKDAATVIADKEGTAYINTSGCAAMAKAGSGDVLTGIIGALIGQGMEMIQAAVYGVYLHGLAGETAAAEKGEYGVLAKDLADFIRP